MIEDDKREKFDEDVRDVFDVESRRGKRPRDPEKLRERRRLLNELLIAKKRRDQLHFTETLQRAGIVEGSEPWKNAWKFFWS
jgi:hypothetical protein